MSTFASLDTLFSSVSSLTQLLKTIQQSDDEYWLVGGCLRNCYLGLEQVDIDIACSADPTNLVKTWANKVGGKWFWLDKQRRQSRVLLPHGLSIDVAPLRAATIVTDLQLRDFTINALALPLDNNFPNSNLIDPLHGINELQTRSIKSCSKQSFADDPLRMIKGIRHAVSLDFTIAAATLKQIKASANLMANPAGERVRTELAKIFASDNVVSGLRLLIDTGTLFVLFGAAVSDWDQEGTITEIERLTTKIKTKGLLATNKQPLGQGDQEAQFSAAAILVFACLIKCYSPINISQLLHQRLRFSRNQQRLIVALQSAPEKKLLALATSITEQRQQALLVEQVGHFAGERVLYYWVYHEHLTIERAQQLLRSFALEQQLGRIPDLLNGKVLAAYLGASRQQEIAMWQQKIKLAEINGEIITAVDAESWLKNELSFDNK